MGGKLGILLCAFLVLHGVSGAMEEIQPLIGDIGLAGAAFPPADLPRNQINLRLPPPPPSAGAGRTRLVVADVVDQDGFIDFAKARDVSGPEFVDIPGLVFPESLARASRREEVTESVAPLSERTPLPGFDPSVFDPPAAAEAGPAPEAGPVRSLTEAPFEPMPLLEIPRLEAPVEFDPAPVSSLRPPPVAATTPPAGGTAGKWPRTVEGIVPVRPFGQR